MDKLRNNIISVVIFITTLTTFFYGIPYLFSSLQIFIQSLIVIILLNLLGIWILRGDKAFYIVENGLVWKLKNNLKTKIFALIVLSVIQLGILGFAFSPLGSKYKSLVFITIIIPSIISSSLLVKERVNK